MPIYCDDCVNSYLETGPEAVRIYPAMSQDPSKSDVLLALGGGTGTCEELGTKLCQRGYAPAVITSGEGVLLPGVRRPFADISADVMQVMDTPLDAITLFTTTTSTRDEAQQCLALARQNGWKSVIVVTVATTLAAHAWYIGRCYVIPEFSLRWLLLNRVGITRAPVERRTFVVSHRRRVPETGLLSRQRLPLLTIHKGLAKI
jgi:hypothetical protein